MPANIESQPYNPSISAPAAADTFSWPGLVGTILVFLIILMVVLWLIRRLNRYSVRNLESPWVRILDRQVLNGQQSLYLIEIAGKIEVLGGTDHHLSKITEINDPDIAAEILEEIAKRPEEKVDKWLSSILKKFRKNKRKDSFSTELEQLLKEVNR